MKRKVRLFDDTIFTSATDVNKELPKGLLDIKAPEMWAKGFTGQGVKIAVIDTGCDVTHPDLAGQIIGGKNFTSEDKKNANIYLDYNGHGTHVAGIIAAKKNDTGVVGAAPNAKLLILKALDKNGQGSYANIVKAINYAVSQKVDIISMSLGGPTDSLLLRNAVKKAVDANICVVCAAANSGDGKPETSEYAYPACYNEVVSVGAMDLYQNVAAFSNSNNQVDLIAPGVDVLSTLPGNKYGMLSGTSMATPYVSGALALIIEWGKKVFARSLSELEIYAQLIKSTVSIGKPKVLEGNGMLYLTAQDELQNIIVSK